MSVNIESMVSSKTRYAIQTQGLHKVAAIVTGMSSPITMKNAVARIGAKAYLQRKEAEIIADGIRALAATTNVKEGGAWEAILSRSVPSAVLGAGVATLPDLLAEGPINQEKLIQHALVGGGIGGVAGGGAALNKALRDPHLDQLIAQAVRP